MSNLQTLLAVVGGFVGIVTFLGGVAIYLRGSADKGTITSLQNSNAALKDEVAVLTVAHDRTVAELKTERDARKHLESKVETLQGIVTQQQEIAHLQHGFDEFRSEVNKYQTESRIVLGAIEEAVTS